MPSKFAASLPARAAFVLLALCCAPALAQSPAIAPRAASLDPVAVTASRQPLPIADLLADLCRQPGHVFWPSDLSLLDSPLVDRDRLLASDQVTDTYLLALAAQHGGRLATFDKRLVTSAVRGGEAARFVLA